MDIISYPARWALLCLFLVVNITIWCRNMYIQEADAMVFHFPNFQNRPSLSLLGGSTVRALDLILLPAKGGMTTAVWFDQPFQFDNGFSTRFTYRMSAIENLGAEGFAFVIQGADPYETGRGGSGIGYDGIEGAIAIEFDLIPSKENDDPQKHHISVHIANSDGELKPKEQQGYSYELKSSLSPFKKSVRVSINYQPDIGTISITFKGEGDEETVRFSIPNIATNQYSPTSTYYAGFTASSSSSSFAQISIEDWYFEAKSSNDPTASLCAKRFDGYGCMISNVEASKECPRKDTCVSCANDVYNCAWCTDAKTKVSKCVVGDSETISGCSFVALEEDVCDESLSRGIFYLISFSVLLVVVFSIVLFYSLPVVQSFRAISLLVSLVLGAVAGALISLVISISLVEVSLNPIVSFLYGAMFVAEAYMIMRHVLDHEIPSMHASSRGSTNELRATRIRIVLLLFSVFWIFITGVVCIVLQKQWVHWLPEWLKVLLFMILAASLNFCVVLSGFDLFNLAREKYMERMSSNSSGNVPNRRRLVTIARDDASLAILIVASIFSGIMFGYVFSTMRIEESEEIFETRMALQKEMIITYPSKFDTPLFCT